MIWFQMSSNNLWVLWVFSQTRKNGFCFEQSWKSGCTRSINAGLILHWAPIFFFLLLDNCFKSDQILSKLEKQYPTSASLWITDGSINNSTEQMDLSLVSFWTNHCFSFSRNSMDHDCLPIYLKGERLLSKNLIESILKIERKPFFFFF